MGRLKNRNPDISFPPPSKCWTTQRLTTSVVDNNRPTLESKLLSVWKHVQATSRESRKGFRPHSELPINRPKREHYFKRYTTVVSMSVGSGVGSPYISHECPAESLR